MKTSTVLLKDEKVKSLGAVFDFGTEYTDVKVSCRSGNEAFIQDTPLSLSFCSPPPPLSPTSHCCPSTPSALETGNRLLTYKQEFEKKKKEEKNMASSFPRHLIFSISNWQLPAEQDPNENRGQKDEVVDEGRKRETRQKA